jgi:hypothetical protein
VAPARLTLQPHTRCLDFQGNQLVELPFSFDLTSLLGHELPHEGLWLRVTARELCSVPVRVAFADQAVSSGLPPLPDGRLHPAVDDLLAAYDAAAVGSGDEAVDMFAQALRDEVPRDDLDGLHVLHAARAATVAAATAGPDGAAALQATAVDWLQTHVRVLGAALAENRRTAASLPAGAAKQRLESAQRYLVEQLGLSS